MSGFNLEDYRHPWETGPHWELKKEFMEKYSEMFPEDRLLCLAQAYSNIVLMQCSYPEPVMRQISLLSQPLQMRKRFQEINKTEDPPQKGKRKNACGDSGKQVKFIKFCAGEKESAEISSHSTAIHKNGSEQSFDILKDNTNSSNSISQNVPCQSQFDSNVKEKNKNQISDFSSTACDGVIERNEIVDSLGLEFIQNFVQETRQFQTKVATVNEALVAAAQKLKMFSEVCFKIESVPNCPPHAPLFVSVFTIKGYSLCSEQGSSKKKAKANCAEKALDTLINLSTKKSAMSYAVAPISTNNTQPVSKSADISLTCNSVTIDLKELQTFSQIIASAKSENIEDILRAAKILKFHNFVKFDISHLKSPLQTKYICKFFVKNILISTAENADLKSVKDLAVKSGVHKLKNLLQYEIKNGELIEKENNVKTSPNLISSSSSTAKSDFQRAPFILNQKMFEASMRDGFMLLDNFSLHSISQQNARAMLSSSASFSRKHFEYKFEDIAAVFPPLKKASIVIGDEIIATATASTKDEAKIIACDIALEILKKKYYTIKVKSEYNEGYIITRSQVFQGESFSSNAITDSNIGCKMLKSMGWTGGGLGTSGIAEPVETQGQNCFGSGLGYSGGQGGDMALFKRRINSMLQDYSRTNTLSDLVFSKEFTKDERKEIHRLAIKFNLHTASQGKNENRFLTIRHKYTVNQVLQYLANNGGSNSKFDLVDATDKVFETQDVCNLKEMNC